MSLLFYLPTRAHVRGNKADLHHHPPPPPSAPQATLWMAKQKNSRAVRKHSRKGICRMVDAPRDWHGGRYGQASQHSYA